MKTKPLTFLLSLTFLFLFSGSVYGEEEVEKEYWDNGKLMSEPHYKDGKREARLKRRQKKYKPTISKIGSQSTINSARSHNSSGGCYDSSITKPVPFMGNNGEVFILSDRSIWEVKYEYEYMYEYYPSVVICPSKNLLIIDGKKLNIQNLSGGGSSGGGDIIESNISGSWNGWNGDTIVKLTNGQIWEQSGLELSLSLGLANDVLIFKKGGIYYMQVEDEDEAVAVRRLK